MREGLKQGISNSTVPYQIANQNSALKFLRLNSDV